MCVLRWPKSMLFARFVTLWTINWNQKNSFVFTSFHVFNQYGGSKEKYIWTNPRIRRWRPLSSHINTFNPSLSLFHSACTIICIPFFPLGAFFYSSFCSILLRVSLCIACCSYCWKCFNIFLSPFFGARVLCFTRSLCVYRIYVCCDSFWLHTFCVK